MIGEPGGIIDIEDLTAKEERPKPVDSKAIVFVSSDKMKASVSLSPPENDGSILGVQELLDALAEKRVTSGIDMDTIESLAHTPTFNTTIDVAFGTPSVPGNPAEVIFKISTEKSLRPKELEDGSVDYKDLGLIQNVSKDDVLCEKIPATPGTPGTDVFGQTIIPKPGKDFKLPAGKNTLLSEDGLQLLAGIDGQAEYINNKITVLNTVTIESDVSMATGNILFVGNVIVKGSVLSGFKVQASGNIDINGNVEAAHIVAGGNIIIRGGFNGMGKGVVQAMGSVTSKYVQAGSVFAKENVDIGYAYNSRVQSGSAIRVVGKKGIVVGGHAIARLSVDSAFYGGRNSPIATIVEVGNDPAVAARSTEIPGEIEACKKALSSSKRLQSILLQLKAAGRLDDEKALTLEKITNTVNAEDTRMSDLEQELITVKEKLETSGYGKINVLDAIFPGVKLIIGSEVFLTMKEYTYCTFSRNEKGIGQAPLAKKA